MVGVYQAVLAPGISVDERPAVDERLRGAGGGYIGSGWKWKPQVSALDNRGILGKFVGATDAGITPLRIAPLMEPFAYAGGNLMVPLAGKRLRDVRVCSKRPPAARGTAICY